MIFIVLVPSVSQTGSYKDDSEINQAGFVCLVVLQCSADLMLLLALDHEQRFRSSGNKTQSYDICCAVLEAGSGRKVKVMH